MKKKVDEKRLNELAKAVIKLSDKEQEKLYFFALGMATASEQNKSA